MPAVSGMSQPELKTYIAEKKRTLTPKQYSRSKSVNKAVNLLKAFTPEKFDIEAGGGLAAQIQRGVEDPTPETPTTAEEVSPYLAKYQQGVFDQAGAPDLRKGLEPKYAQPTPISRVEEREKLRVEYGLEELETTLTDLKAQEEEAFATLRQRKGIEEGKPVPLGVISGRITEIERQERENIEFIQRQKARVVDELNTKYSVVNQYVSDLALDYGDAVKRYNDDFNRNIQIYKLVEEEEDEQRQIARTNLQLYTDSILKGAISYGDLSSDEKVFIKKLEVQSGLAPGFTERLKVEAPNSKVISTTTRKVGNRKYSDSVVRMPDGTWKVVTMNLGQVTTGDGKPTESEFQRSAISDMGRTLSENAGADGNVSPDQWKESREVWRKVGLKKADFESEFRDYVNEEHYQDYGVEY